MTLVNLKMLVVKLNVYWVRILCVRGLRYSRGGKDIGPGLMIKPMGHSLFSGLLARESPREVAN